MECNGRTIEGVSVSSSLAYLTYARILLAKGATYARILLAKGPLTWSHK
jgi:hypothetical protein